MNTVLFLVYANEYAIRHILTNEPNRKKIVGNKTAINEVPQIGPPEQSFLSHH